MGGKVTSKRKVDEVGAKPLFQREAVGANHLVIKARKRNLWGTTHIKKAMT